MRSKIQFGLFSVTAGSIVLVLSVALDAVAVSLNCSPTSGRSINRTYKVESVSPHPIGEGSIVRVYGGTIKTTDGQIEQIALKSFSSYQQAQDAYRQVGMLRPVFESEAGARFNRVVVAGVDCKAPKGSSNRLNLPNAILMERATGASHQLQDLNLTVEEAALDSREFRRKIKVIKKFRDQNLEALNALKKHGLVHSDIKPSNILYKLVPGTNPAKLTEDQIEFQIADYDGVVHNGQRIKVSTHEYRSPETLEVKEIAGKKAVLNMASNEQDLYALGNSVFELVSGDHPIDYYSS